MSQNFDFQQIFSQKFIKSTCFYTPSQPRNVKNFSNTQIETKENSEHKNVEHKTADFFSLSFTLSSSLKQS